MMFQVLIFNTYSSPHYLLQLMPQGCNILQTQDLRVDQEKEPCIRINTRELNRELYTRLFILYTNT